jgi:sugar phosphate isomerase/epimerase
MQSRRQVGKLALGGVALAVLPRLKAAKVDSTIRGVKMGLITGSLNPLPETPAGKDVIDTVIEGCLAVGAANVELVNLLEPRLLGAVNFGHPPNPMTPEYQKSRADVREWRLKTPIGRFVEIRKKFDNAGLNLFSYVMTFDLDFTDEEMDAVFKQMQALKVGCFCTNQSRLDVAPRLVPFAQKYKIKPAWHPHALVNDPNEVATAEGMEKLLAMSPQFAINLDIGHFSAGNNDAVDFLKKHHNRITHIHIKDRKRNGGPNVALGTGDTPIKECLALIRDNKWPIYGIIEREYRDAPGNAVEQTKGQMEYLKQLLNS